MKADPQFISGLVVGLALGLIGGFALWRASATQPPATRATVVADPTPPSAPPLPEVRVTLGRGHASAGYMRYPVVVDNLGAFERFVTVSCGFYARTGELIGNGKESFRALAHGARANGALLVAADDPAEFARYECNVG
jgi:hypothetical protein